jgi:hypothetical protein
MSNMGDTDSIRHRRDSIGSHELDLKESFKYLKTLENSVHQAPIASLVAAAISAWAAASSPVVHLKLLGNGIADKKGIASYCDQVCYSILFSFSC